MLDNTKDINLNLLYQMLCDLEKRIENLEKIDKIYSETNKIRSKEITAITNAIVKLNRIQIEDMKDCKESSELLREMISNK